MFAPLFPLLPEAVQFLYQYNFDLTPIHAFSSNACHTDTEQFSALLLALSAPRLPEPARPLGDPPVRWRSGASYADVRWDQLSRIHDVVGIQRTLYSFHRPQ